MSSSPTASSTVKGSPSPSGYTAPAQRHGSRNTVAGAMSFRAAYREGHDAGRRHALAAYLNSPLMEQMALELTVLRTALAAMTQMAAEREELILALLDERADCEFFHGATRYGRET